MLASDLHRQQLRKGTRLPYVSHLLAVASSVLDQGGDEDEAIAALLHDAVEDQGGQPTLERIRHTFGDRVAAIVSACSDTDQARKPAWRHRKEAYIEHLIATDLDPGVLRAGRQAAQRQVDPRRSGGPRSRDLVPLQRRAG